MTVHKWAVRFAVAMAMAAVAFALDTSKLKPSGYVNDFANAISPAAKTQLTAYCADLERATGVQMAIVTVATLDDEPVEDVGNRLFHEWGIGKKGKDDGVLLLFAIQDRKNSIELGYGIEPLISDGEAGSILRGVRPILRSGDYGGAILAAAQQIGQKIADQQGVEISGQPRVRRIQP
ncbi:MAG TPA: TPM domain-containing protein, partial [Bryobacteraceae bacterium]|nr:TPM domain-containing protein [Bryobacteraceae bacterium]